MNRRKQKLLTRLAERREALAARIATEPDPARKAKAMTALDDIDRRIAALSAKRFIPLPVIIAIINAIALLLQWLQSTSP